MVSEEEQALIRERMAEAGIRNMGAYMRKMALNGYVLHVDLSPVRELVSLQRRCSNNLNQVAIQANTYGGIYPEEIAALLGCPRGMVLSRLMRARKLLRDLLKEMIPRKGLIKAGSPPWWSFDPPGSGVLPLPGFHDFGTLCPKVAKAAYREEGYSRPQPTSGPTR